MDAIIEYIIMFALGWIMGGAAKEIFMRLVFRDILKDLGVTEQQLRNLARAQKINLDPQLPAAATAPEIPVVEIKIEQHQGQLYAYRIDNGRFLGQGADRESLTRSIAESYKGIHFVVPDGQGKELVKNG